MTCQEARQFLDGYVDGELDLARTLEIERHIHRCPACGKEYASRQAMKTALADNSLYYALPSSLHSRITQAIRKEAGTGPSRRAVPWRSLALAAMLALAATVIWAAVRLASVPTSTDILAQAVVSSHIRSLMPGHLTDVLSSDQHTVKPWFNGKLDFSPVVEDLAEQGFPLVGGRLDYLNDRPVAALVYHRHQHIINLYIWPSKGQSDTPPQVVSRQGYHMLHWTQGMSYWAVSDVSENDLREFARLIK